jgi:DNA-directed RNA polymerase specialized sigma24 family protein
MSTPDDGFSEWFRVEYGPVLRVVRVIVGDQAVAQEVTQDAFEQALRRWSRVRDHDRPGAWVRRVAIRRAVRVRDRRIAEPAFVPPDPPTGADVDLLAAVAALPRAQRAAVALFYLEDRPVAEVAELMECSESTVKVHLHRARARLAVALALDPEEVAGE